MSYNNEFDERWCRLEGGSILFARTTWDEVDEESEELGYVECVNYTILDPGCFRHNANGREVLVPAYESGQFMRKEGWTVEDFSVHNWGVRPVAFYDVVDEYDLRDAIEYEKWPMVARYARAYPELFKGIIPTFEQLGLMRGI